MGDENLNPLEELKRLDQQVGLVASLEGLKPIYYRLDEIAKQYANDFEVQLVVGDIKQHLVNRGTKLKEQEATIATPPSCRLRRPFPYVRPPTLCGRLRRSARRASARPRRRRWPLHPRKPSLSRPRRLRRSRRLRRAGVFTTPPPVPPRHPDSAVRSNFAPAADAFASRPAPFRHRTTGRSAHSSRRTASDKTTQRSHRSATTKPKNRWPGKKLWFSARS